MQSNYLHISGSGTYAIVYRMNLINFSAIHLFFFMLTYKYQPALRIIASYGK